MKKRIFLFLLCIIFLCMPLASNGITDGAGVHDWFYTDFGLPEEYIREDPEQWMEESEKRYLPKAPYHSVGWTASIEFKAFEKPDHRTRVESFKNSDPLVLIVAPTYNAVQYTVDGLRVIVDGKGFTLTQTRVIEVLRNDTHEPIEKGDTIWLKESYFWYTDKRGTQVFTSPYGARCKPLTDQTTYMISATRFKEASKQSVYSFDEQYFWATGSIDPEVDYYYAYENQLLYSAFWEINDYKEDVLVHFGLMKGEQQPSQIPIVAAAALFLVAGAIVVTVILAKNASAREEKAAPTSD